MAIGAACAEVAAGCCVGTDGAGNCGGWSKVGGGKAVGDADAVDDPVQEAGAGLTAVVGGIGKDVEPEAGALAMPDDAEEAVGQLAAGDARDLDDQDRAGSVK